MTNYSRTTLRELKKRYLNILKKCLLANLMAFSFVLPSVAETVIPTVDINTWDIYSNIHRESSTTSLGGAVVNLYNSTPTFTSDNAILFGGDTRAEGISATVSGGYWGRGTAVWTSEGNATFNNVTIFKNNVSTAIDSNSTVGGGALWNGGSIIKFTGEKDILQSDHFLTSFIDNEVTGIKNSEGGAVYTWAGETYFLGNTLFKDNKASNTNSGASAGALSNYSKVVFGKNTHTVFQDNEAVSGNSYAKGGAIHNAGVNAVLIFNDEALFKNNKAESETGAAEGGAIHNSGGSVVFEDTGNNAETPAVPNITYGMSFKGDTLFTGNKAESDSGTTRGGAIYNSGYMLLAGENTFGGYQTDENGEYLLDSEGNKISLGNQAKRGGAIFNSGGKKEGDVIAYGMTLGKSTFMGNTALSSGGAIYNAGYMNFTDEALFEGNKVENSDGDVQGVAILNGGTINFADVYFINNQAISQNKTGQASAIYNSGSNAKIMFGGEVLFQNNISKGVSGTSYGAIVNNSGSITFQGDTKFIGNRIESLNNSAAGVMNTGKGSIFFNSSFEFIGNEAKAAKDIYNSSDSIINFNHGVDKNGVALVGSFDGGITNHGIINKTGAGTLILGDEMVNSGTGGTFNQSAGLTIAHTDHFLIGTNNITGGELRVHGADTNKLKATVSNGAMLTYLTTGAERQNVALGTNVSVIGANVMFGADESIGTAKYTLGSDIASDERALKVIIQDSNIKMTGDTYAGSYEIGSSNVIEMRDESIEETNVTFADLDGSGATLGIDIALLKDSEGKTQLTADRLNLTSDGEGYKFAGVSFNTPMDGQALLDEILSGLMVGQDGTITPSIKHTVQVLGGNASFMGRKEATLSTASPYVYEVATKGQDLTVSASVLKGSALEYLNDTDTDVTLQIAEKGATDYTVTEDLSSMGVGKKQILGFSNVATESVINASGKNLFTLDKSDTELQMKGLTITGAGTAIDNQAGKAHLDNVVISDTVGDTALKNGAEMTLKDVVVDKGVVNSGKLTMSGNNSLSTLTNNGETTVEEGKLSVTTLGGNGTLTMNGAELDSTNIATNNTIVSNGMTVSDRLSTLGVKSLEVKDGTTLDLNLAMTTADKIKNEGDMIANKDLSVGALEGAGTLTVNNATLDVADKFETTNKVVSNGMKIGDNVTSEIHFADLEIKDNTTLDIKTLQATANTVTVGENATLGITLKNLDEYGTMKADEIIAKEDSKVHLTLGDNFAGGVFDVFKGTKGSGDLKLVHNNVYHVVEVSEGKYSFMAKDTEALQESLGTTDNETVIANALTQGTTGHAVFSRMQSEMLVALQSLETETVAKAKKALSAVGAKEQPIEQSVASEHLVALQNVVQAELHGAGVGRAGGDMDPRAKVYIKGLYDRTKSSQGEGFRARSKGAVLGVQSEVTEDLTLGVGYATSQTTAKEDLRRTEVDTNTGFVSAHYQPNAWWVSGLATFSRGEYEEEKQILSSMGKASYNVDSWGAQVMTGYDIKLENTIITPEVGLRYLSVKQEGYTDTLGTTVSGTRSDYLTALVGVKGTWDMGAIRPTAGITVGYDVISDDVSALNTLVNGASYTVNGEALDRLSTGVSLGVEADLGNRTTLKLEYSGTYRKEYVDHSGMLKLEVKF